MVSFDVPRTLIATGALTLGVLAASDTAMPQRLPERAAHDVRQIVEEIRDEQALNGPYSADLLDPLTTLGLFYQEDGDHAAAAAAIERALQVVRANYGLRTLEQAPLLRQWIHNEEARGNVGAAWDLEQQLLALAREHPDDLRTVPILHEVGDKRMDLLRRYVRGEFSPQIVLGCFYAPSQQRWGGDSAGPDVGSCHSGSKGVAVQTILYDAQRNYAAAIGIFLRNEAYSSDELHQLEMQLIRTSYLYGGNYELGRRSLRRLIAYDVANSEPWLSRVNALIELADWDLLFAHNGLALDTYANTYRLLKARGIEQTSIDEIFSPQTPVVLPTFLPNPLISGRAREGDGYIDVAFDLTKYGTSRRVEILDASNVTDATKDNLVRAISRSRFRPRVTGDGFARLSPVIFRYYANEPGDEQRKD